MGGHVFNHVQGHISGAYRPGVVPTKAPSVYVPTERIGNTNFSSGGSGWVGDFHWDFSGNNATAVLVPTDYDITNSAYYVFSSPIPAGTTFTMEVTVTDNALDQSGIFVAIYNGTTLVTTLFSEVPATIGVYSISEYTLGEIDRISILCDPTSTAPGLVISNVSFIA